MKIVIIGNHCAGLTSAETLRKADRTSSITMISKEDVPPYSRCLLNYIISGRKTVNDILFKPEQFYKINSIETMFGLEAINVFPDNKEILLNTSGTVKYDKLIIATGGDPATTDIKGANTAGVFGLRSLADAIKIREYCKNVTTAVVSGGGLVGVKAATALFELGKKVKLLVGSSSILSQNMDIEEALMLEEHLASHGIEIIKNTSIIEIYGKDKVEGIKTGQDDKVECQIVVVGKGVEANKSLVEGTKIETEHGIIIDDHCRTTVPDIYAAGDVAQGKDSVRKCSRTNALWPLAAEEGRVAAENILGKDSVLRERTSMNSLNLLGLPVVSCGLTGVRDKVRGIEKVIIKDKNKRSMNKFVFQNNKLVGFVLIGNIANAGVLTTLVRKEINIDGAKDKILSGKYDLSSVLPVIRKNSEKFNEVEFREVINLFRNIS